MWRTLILAGALSLQAVAAADTGPLALSEDPKSENASSGSETAPAPVAVVPATSPSTSSSSANLTPEDIERIRKRMSAANSVYAAGVVGTGGGLVMGTAGLVLMVVGVIPAVLGEPVILETGVVLALVGGGVLLISLPITTTGAMLGALVLRREGIRVPLYPGWISVAGIGTVVIGAVADIGPMVGVGLGAIVGGATWQVIASHRAMKPYRDPLRRKDRVAVGPALLPTAPAAAVSGSRWAGMAPGLVMTRSF